MLVLGRTPMLFTKPPAQKGAVHKIARPEKVAIFDPSKRTGGLTGTKKSLPLVVAICVYLIAREEMDKNKELYTFCHLQVFRSKIKHLTLEHWAIKLYHHSCVNWACFEKSHADSFLWPKPNTRGLSFVFCIHLRPVVTDVTGWRQCLCASQSFLLQIRNCEEMYICESMDISKDNWLAKNNFRHSRFTKKNEFNHWGSFSP